MQTKAMPSKKKQIEQPRSQTKIKRKATALPKNIEIEDDESGDKDTLSPDTIKKRQLKNKDSTFSSVSDIAMYKVLTGTKEEQKSTQRGLNKK
tara:strand:+ start:315 stop:593 length:279 start_codon:yes stop_codon:yes gene_type:complete